MVQLSVKDVTRESKVHLLGKPFKILLICFVYFFVICTFSVFSLDLLHNH